MAYLIKNCEESYPRIISSDQSQLFRLSCRFGFVRLVKYSWKSVVHNDTLIHDGLCRACEYGHLEVIRLLLNQVYSLNRESLFWIISEGYLEILQTIVPSNSPFYHYLIKEASKYGQINIVKYLLDIFRSEPDYGGTRNLSKTILNEALISASEGGYISTVKFLVEEGANIHWRSDECLNRASCMGRTEIVEYLLRKGIENQSHKDFALCMALRNYHPDIQDLLLDWGANYQDATMIMIRVNK